MRKKILAILLAVVLSVSMLPAAVSADGGEFTFDAETGTITGYTDKSVTELVIPAEIDGVAVTAIGDGAFYSFESLTSVTIPNGVTEIGESAFNWCKSLTSMTIPESVTMIGYEAFTYCDNLTAINVAEGNGTYVSADGVLYTKDVETLVCCPGGKNGELAIPNSVTTIGEYAFRGCSNLTSVTIPNGVATIKGWAFLGCESLTSLTIPKSVTTIGHQAIDYCDSLTEINVADGNSAYASADGVLYTKDMKTLIQ